jgi:general secretion pathway protein J
MKHRGFTLVEVLVAIVLLAVLSGLAWRALDAMLRTREITQQSIERTATLQTALAQWEQDLAQLQDSGKIVPALEFDGQALRLTRRHDQGLQVVVWRVAEGRWTRWAAEPVRSVAQLREAWRRGQQPLLQQNVLTVMEGVQGWQMAYYIDNAWANALSSRKESEALPRGVRVQLDFANGGNGWAGPLTRAIALVGSAP